MRKIKNIMAALIVMLGLGVAVPAFVSPTANAADSAADKILEGQQKVGGSENKTSLEDQIKVIVNIMLFILGAIAVIMIIIGGIRYAISNGDSSSIKAAKDTILYAVIGLIVAIMAYAIVNFVVGTAFGGK